MTRAERIEAAAKALVTAEGRAPKWQYDRVFGAVTGEVRASKDFVDALKALRAALAAPESGPAAEEGEGARHVPTSTTEVPRPYDKSIHSNPDAAAWARFFVETWREVQPEQSVPDVGWMQGWFANAMMAMHDHLASRAAPSSTPPSAPPPTEAHVQRAVVSEALMDAMNRGAFRCGAIIFEAPVHGEFRGWAILAPWPWIRGGNDTPWTMIERFKAQQAAADAQPTANTGRIESVRALVDRAGALIDKHAKESGITFIGREPVPSSEWEGGPYCTRCHLTEALHHAPNIYTGRKDALGHPYPPACDQFVAPVRPSGGEGAP